MSGFAEERAPYGARMTKAEFLHWVQEQEGRFELVDGRVVMQAGGTQRHSWIAARFITAFSTRLDPAAWAVGTADLAVEIGEDIRFPDVVVERLIGDGTALSTGKPVVLVEVTSGSSEETDSGVKLDQYTSLTSLECYIVASQKEARCLVWQRGGEGRAFSAKPAIHKGQSAAIAIDALGISIPLEEIYRNLSPTDPT
jgi:Uma2 family endonuclease